MNTVTTLHPARVALVVADMEMRAYGIGFEFHNSLQELQNLVWDVIPSGRKIPYIRLALATGRIDADGVGVLFTQLGKELEAVGL